MADPAAQVSVGALGYCFPPPSFVCDVLLLSRLSAIFDDTKPKSAEPVVQCVQVKLLPNQTKGQERYRVVFSDISNYIQTMLATRMLKCPRGPISLFSD